MPVLSVSLALDVVIYISTLFEPLLWAGQANPALTHNRLLKRGIRSRAASHDQGSDFYFWTVLIYFVHAHGHFGLNS